MGDEFSTRGAGLLLLLLVAIVGLLGIAMMIVLAGSWKRFNQRNRAVPPHTHRPTSPEIDAWSLSGKRMGDEPQPNQSEFLEDNEADEDDEDDEDDEAPPSGGRFPY